MSNANDLSRRDFIAAAASIGFGRTGQTLSNLPYGNGTIPRGIRVRAVPNVNGLTVNILEAGFDRSARLP